MSFFRKFDFLFLAFATAFPAPAQNPASFTSLTLQGSSSRSLPSISGDRHLQDTSVGVLFANSAFAHGYRHGYEQGFHIGDLDLHMGRAARFSFQARECQPASREYDLRFGSKLLFRRGYEAGFRNGYSDAAAGWEFRATERLKIAASGLGTVLAPSRRASFDEGFRGGFQSSQSHDAPTLHMTTEYLEHYCLSTSSASYGLEYCSGFSRGYMLGTFTVRDVASKSPESQTTGH